MHEATKDVLYFIFLGNFTGFFLTWFIFYPYYGSYIKCENPDLEINHLAGGYIVMYIGIITGSRIMPQILNKMGFQRMFYMFAGFYFINVALFVYTFSFFWILINLYFSGILFQIYILGSSTYFRIKYPEKFAQFFGLVSLGQAACILFVIFLLQLIVNPQNDSMDYIFNGDTIFPPTVSINVPTYLWLQAYMSSIAIVVISSFIDPQIGKHFDSTIKPPSYGELDEQLFSNESVVEKEFDWKKEITSRKFLFIFIATVTRYCSNEFLISNYHYIGNIILKSDSLSATVFAIASVSNIIARISSGFFWQKFGLIKSYYFCYFCSILLDCTYLFWAYDSFIGFFFIANLVRFTMVYNYLFTSVTLFTVYDIKTALKLAPFYDFNNLVRSSLSFSFQFVFLHGLDFRPVFWGFLVFESICLFAFSRNLNESVLLTPSD